MGYSTEYNRIMEELERFEDDVAQKLSRLRRSISNHLETTLVNAGVAAKVTGLAESTIRQAGQRGTITKYNEDGSKKIHNGNTAVFYDLDEIQLKLKARAS